MASQDPNDQHLGRSTQRSLSRQEHSGSAHVTPQLGARSRVNRSWGSPTTEADQVPGSSKITSIPGATTAQLAEPSTRSGTKTMEKGTQNWAASGQNHKHLHMQPIGSL